MKKIVILIPLIAVLMACQSEYERKQAERQALLDKQIATCKTDIEAGKEPTQFCLALLPEYRSLVQQPAVVQAPSVSQEPQAQYQQPVYAQPQQPVVVQQAAPVQDNTARDMLTGALIGHALSGGGGNSPGMMPMSSQPRVTNNITRNVTVINKAPVVAAPAPKTNYMDTSKFKAATPAPVPKGNYMPTAKFGKR